MLKMVGLLTVRKQPEVGFARDFAEKMGLPIAIYPGANELNELLDIAQVPAWQKLQKERLCAAIPGASIIDNLVNQPGFVIVSNSLARKETAVRSQSGLLILAPHEERGFDCHGKKRILVPFGREETTVKALLPAICIAKKIGASIILYHTTRPNPKCASVDWRDHMTENALAGEKSCINLCRQMGIPYKVRITSVYPGVVAEGIANAAYDDDCHLIVMSMAADVVFGSHTGQALEYSAVPTLIAT